MTFFKSMVICIWFFGALGENNPRVKMILVNEAGQFPYRDHPEQFNADLMHFIDFWNNNP